MQPVTAREPQRRERKKRQTRDALVHAALALFNAKGYEDTAVREITDAVDVSERTFFRYFAGKEDLVLSFVGELTDAFLRQLASRPAAEPPFTALTNAFTASLLELTTEDGPESQYLMVMKMIDITPSLLAALVGYTHSRDDEVVRLLAAREGIDPDADRRPRLAALAYNAVTMAATSEWRAGGDDSAAALLAAFEACAAQLLPAVAGHWT
jgi:AcrR family transcriptional regulator